MFTELNRMIEYEILLPEFPSAVMLHSVRNNTTKGSSIFLLIQKGEMKSDRIRR